MIGSKTNAQAHVFTFVLVGASLFAASAACTGPGPGKSTFTEGDVAASTPSVTDDDDDDATNASSSTSSGGGGDQVFGASTFKYISPGKNANEHLATHTGKVPLDGKDCVTAGCHLDTKPWAFAGTVYTKASGGTTVAEAEVGIVYPDNKVKSAMTDANGNFWFDGTDYPPAGAKVGVRANGKSTKIMKMALPAPPAGRACNSTPGCHGDAAIRIYTD